MFEERFIAFVDILGFKEIVKRSITDVKYQVKISKILNYIAKIRNDNYDEKWKDHEVICDVSVFSDSIVISYPCDRSNGDGLFYLLMDLIFICFDLINNGIYVRGGVTVGELIHDQNISWGSAFIEAYKLEENNAIYPRIVIDEKAIKTAKKLYAKAHSYDKNGNDLDMIIKRDKDGVYYLDYLSQYEEFDWQIDYEQWMNCIRKNVEENINSSQCAKIKMKYVWFANYYNDTVKMLPFKNDLKTIDL